MDFSIGGLALMLALVCAVIAAKWAMDLGFSQFGQTLWGIVGFVAGPLVLLILYVRLLHAEKGPAKQWF